MHATKRSAPGGFTLVELLVVIAIISLLISILAPSLNVAKDIAKQTVCAANLNSAGKGIHLYCEMNADKYPPYRSRMKSGKPITDRYVWVENTMWAAKEGDLDPVMLTQLYRGLGMVYGAGFIESPHYFYCVAQKYAWFDYQEYVTDRATGQTVQWGTMDNWSQMIRIGYLHNAWGKEYKPGEWDIAFKSLTSIEADKALMIDHALFPWCSAVHIAAGVESPTFNILFPDGRVESRRSTVAIEIMIWGATTAGDIVKSWGNGPGGPYDSPDDWHDLYTLINEGV